MRDRTATITSKLRQFTFENFGLYDYYRERDMKHTSLKYWIRTMSQQF